MHRGSRELISRELAGAREYETLHEADAAESDRPVYHLSPRIGWLNDPNGFSYYNGRYHLFYQYHPYDSFWGPMHWGHAVSDDMIRWEYLPAALAPDTDYDGAGCFSGSAVTMPDGRQLLMYTGCATYGQDTLGRWRQTQCIAVSDGDEFIKYAGNPVISDELLPEGGDIYEFRDPYLWVTGDGSYRALVANASISDSEATRLVVYRSDDGFSWERQGILFEDFLKIGIMWECPNFFELDGSQVLIASPMNMEEEEAEGSVRFPKGNNVCYILGTYDEENEQFTPCRERADRFASYHPVDCGLDFYAPQVKKLPDGRCILIGWMQDPDMANRHDASIRTFGMMTIPRELSVRDGRLHQAPVRELGKYRTAVGSYRGVRIGAEDVRLDGISGRSLDLELDIDGSGCRELRIRWAQDESHHIELRWRTDQSVLTIDRSRSGQSEEITRHRPTGLYSPDGHLRLRMIMDRWSAEIFVNEGEKVISVTYYTDPDAQDISFSADGTAVMDVTGYKIDIR